MGKHNECSYEMQQAAREFHNAGEDIRDLERKIARHNEEIARLASDKSETAKRLIELVEKDYGEKKPARGMVVRTNPSSAVLISWNYRWDDIRSIPIIEAWF